MTERWNNQSEVRVYFTQLFIYFITVNKYRFCISVVGNMPMIGISYKKNQYRSITNLGDTFFCQYVCVLPGNWTHNLFAANAMLYHWATGTLFFSILFNTEQFCC